MMKEKQKKYKKPELTKIQLMAEEVLAPGCKFPGGGPGPNGIGCGLPARPCFKSGS